MLAALKAIFRSMGPRSAGAQPCATCGRGRILVFAVCLALFWEIVLRPLLQALLPDAAMPPSYLHELLSLVFGLPGI